MGITRGITLRKRGRKGKGGGEDEKGAKEEERKEEFRGGGKEVPESLGHTPILMAF